MAELHLRPDWQRVIEARAAAGRKQVADRIAEKVREAGVTVGDVDGGPSEYDLPVRVFDNDDDSRVALAHPAGKAVHQKHRLLPRAAAALGLEIH